MDFFDSLGDLFNSVTGAVERGIRGMFGSSNERDIRRIGYTREKDGTARVLPETPLARINDLEPVMQKLSDDELRETATRIRARLAAGQTLDDVLPDVFAATREAGRRYLKMRHYDVQMVGGCILHGGKIAEMVTGEGKTLVATLPTALNAMGGHVHVITVNDYLARRDMEWMAPIYMGLGLTVNCIQSSMRPNERQPSYACDITYGTNNEFGFDYLRDNMKPAKNQQVQGPLDFALIDEVDNILIDEARTPLIISGPAHDDIEKYPKADAIARQLTRDVDFEVKEKEHTCHLTEEGIRRAEKLAGVESFYTAGNMEWPHLIDNSLKAHHLYKRDVNYVVEPVEDGKLGVVIVDEHTGRKMHGRQWSDGLHQAVESKERVPIKKATQTLATITLQNYFKLYRKLAGMTGTALTEAQEFYKIYGLDVVAVPTNRPMQRINYPDVIYRSEQEKWQAVLEEIREVHQTGRPILVGTVSIEKSEKLSGMLGKYGIKHAVLNAKYHEREAEFVAQAGRLGAVTIATNMAGRGTDIILGGNPEHMAWEELHRTYESRLDVPKSVWDAKSDEVAEREGMKAEGRKVAEVGGLHVIGTERHDARRIDLQLRGRAGRQGDPGSSRFYLSLEDDLMRIFAGDKVKEMLTWLGMQEGEAIESKMVTRQIEKAQKRVEERHFESRKNLLEYDEVMDHQRKEVYKYRQRILDGANCRDLILDMIDRQAAKACDHFLSRNYRWETVKAYATHKLGVSIDAADVRDMERGQLVEFLTDEAEQQAESLIVEQMAENLPEGSDRSEWNWQAITNWANRVFGQNFNVTEMKRLANDTPGEEDIDRDALQIALLSRARESIQRQDFSDIDPILEDEFPQRQLCGFLKYQFNLTIEPQAFASCEDPHQAAAIVRGKVRELYREKEVHFPVAVGLTRFLGQRGHVDRDGLRHWANARFAAELAEDDFKEKERDQIAGLLDESSRTFFPNDDVDSRVDAMLDRVWRDNGEPGVRDNATLQELIAYANREFEASLKLDEIEPLDRDHVRQAVLQSYDQRYRPEFGHAERMLLLDVLDHAWKDHLYFMDHLRQNIGLVGYAQKDPKVEYKREGMKAFESMWDGIGERVTAAIFRLETESPDFVGSLWQVSAATHQQAQAAVEEFRQEAASGGGQNGAGAAPEPGQQVQAVEPIRNRSEKVKPNEPCPCGSGKKYKKCCGI
ncbi:MAG: preprotein translocase subunit SecA [Planctomycetaceae bacterium]